MSQTDEIDHTTATTTFQHESVVTPSATGDDSTKTTNVDAAAKVNDAASNSKAKGWVQFEDEDNKKADGDNVPQMETVDLSEKVNGIFSVVVSF